MYKPISTYTGRHFTPWGSTLWLAPERHWCVVKRTKRHCFVCSMTAQRRI